MRSRYRQFVDHCFPLVEQDYTVRDSILYALGVGAAHNPLDPLERRLVVEDNLVALHRWRSSWLFCPGFWYCSAPIGIDHRQVVHASERIELDAPLTVEFWTDGKVESIRA